MCPEIRFIIDRISFREGAGAPRPGALRPSQKIQRYMDLLATLGDDPMDIEGGKRRKKKKSTRKKKRGGVRPDSSRSDTSSDGQNQNRTGDFDAKIAFKVRDDFTLRKVPVPPTRGTPGGMADRKPLPQGA